MGVTTEELVLFQICLHTLNIWKDLEFTRL